VGDNDGVLAIPQEIAEEVLLEAERRVTSESATRNLLKQGVSAPDASAMTERQDL
jgi:regulator of RNase E activity RraA